MQYKCQYFSNIIRCAITALLDTWAETIKSREYNQTINGSSSALLFFLVISQWCARGSSAQCGSSNSHQITQGYGMSPRNTLGIKATVDWRGLCSCSRPANWVPRTRSRRKHIFDITQHDNFSRVTERQSIQINLTAETISLFIRICTLHLLRPRALSAPWSWLFRPLTSLSALEDC